jgi:hypothetical protein
MHVYEKLDGMSAWLLGFITLRELLEVLGDVGGEPKSLFAFA